MSLVALPDGAVPLVVGTVLALGALTLVLSPLLSGEAEVRAEDEQKAAAEAARIKAARAKRLGRQEEQLDGAVAALREIEFDRETGKLSDSDYAELKTRYTREALAELRAADARDAAAVPVLVPGLSPADAADPVEAMKWNILSAKSGRGDAELDSMMDKLTETQKQEAQARADAFTPLAVK